MLGRPSALALLKDLAAMISDGTGAEHQWAGRSPCGAGRAAHRMSFSLRMRARSRRWAAGIARVRMTLGTPRSAIAPVVVRYPDGRRTLFEYEVTDTDGETEIRRSSDRRELYPAEVWTRDHAALGHKVRRRIVLAEPWTDLPRSDER
jgi:hypothetical protein